jgi:CheY-like chemotaxis protein
MKVLIVDQQERFLDACVERLEKADLEVVAASNGIRALKLVEQEVFDLVGIGLALPDLSGIDVLRSIREQGHRMPAILFSFLDVLSLDTVADAMRLGATDVLEKPFEPEFLLERVEDILAHNLTSGVRGNLREMGLPSLITVLCNEGKQAALSIRHGGREGTLFFERGEICHAVLDGRVGEEAVYEALTWSEGEFVMTMGRSTPEHTVHASWSGLLLEGLRRLDETSFDQELLPEDEGEDELDFSAWPAEEEMELPAEVRRTPSFDLDPETQTAVDERLARLYRSLLLRCVLLTDRSGRVLYVQGDIERSNALSLAALVAGSFSASREVAHLLAHRGEERHFQQSLQEGTDINLYTAQAGPNWVLAVAFTSEATKLGMARLLTLQTAADLAELSAQAMSLPEQQEEVAHALDESFRQGVGDALEDLFG